MLKRIFPAALATTFILAGLTPVSAQIPAGRRAEPKALSLPKALIGNPWADSRSATDALAIGNAMRTRLQAMFPTTSADGWQFATRASMNESLAAWGYPADANLSPAAVRSFAVNIGTGVLVSSELERGKDSLYTVVAHMYGTAFDDTGQTFVLTQKPGQKLDEFGKKVGEAIAPAFKAYKDAQLCWDRNLDAKKREEAVARAYRILPNFGLVARCQSDIVAATEPNSDARLALLEKALQGDSLSLETYRDLARAYLARATEKHDPADSNKVVETYQRILEVAPSDEDQLKAANLVFRQFGRPKAAQEVADRMLQNDPASLTGLDLRSNSCVADGDYKCAIAALEQFYEIDSDRADSVFFRKIAFVAQAAEDTAKLEKWVGLGLEKDPKDLMLLGLQGQVRLMRNDPDGAFGVVEKIIANGKGDFDSEQTLLVRRIVDSYLKSGQLDKVVKVHEAVAKVPDQEELATELANQVLARAQDKYGVASKDTAAADFPGIISAADAYLAMTPKGQYVGIANFFAGYSELQLYARKAQVATNAPSCAAYQDLLKLLNSAGKHAEGAKSAQEAWANGILQQLPEIKSGIEQNVAQLCKP